MLEPASSTEGATAISLEARIYRLWNLESRGSSEKKGNIYAGMSELLEK